MGHRRDTARSTNHRVVLTATVPTRPVPGLLYFPLTTEQRQAGTSSLPWITPEGTREIRGERDHSAGSCEFLGVVVRSDFASPKTGRLEFDRSAQSG